MTSLPNCYSAIARLSHAQACSKLILSDFYSDGNTLAGDGAEGFVVEGARDAPSHIDFFYLDDLVLCGSPPAVANARMVL